MSYFTEYTLYVEVKDILQMEDVVNKILELNLKDKDFLYPISTNHVSESGEIPILNKSNTVFKLESKDMAKWYEHETDMKKLSKEFPVILFKLSGEGEESGDVWVKYFLNEKNERIKCKNYD